MRPLKYILFFCLFLSAIYSNSQNINSVIKAGKNAFDNGNYYGAAKSFKLALKNDKSQHIAYLCAESCRLNHDYPCAIKWYRYVIASDMKKYPLAVFWLADVYKSSGDYQKAQYNYNKFLRHIEKNGLFVEEYYKIKAEYEVIACEKAFYNKLNPVGFDILHLDSAVNSVYSDFGVTDINDSILLYGSLRPADSVNFYARLYLSNKTKGQYSKNKLFEDITISDTLHITNPFFSNKQQALYFCLSPSNTNKIESKIYMSKLIDGKWQKPEQLSEKINKQGFITTQPSVARIGNKEYLMFVSNRSGGIGKLDIWYCEILQEQEFGEVLNLGSNLNKYDKSERFYIKQTSVINSIDNDITPFYNYHDSTLYFSSQWHQSLGGYDIFKVKGDFENWGKVENMGYPVNTNDNELYFYINSKGKNAYFVSNRTGSFTYNNDRCCNDIYTFEIPEYINEEEETARKINILEKEIKLLVPLTLYFHNDEPNPKTRDTLTSLSYEQTYFDYINMVDEYKTEYSRKAKKSQKDSYKETIQSFFNDEVKKGYNDLVKFSLLMEELLKNGDNIEITIKGFASPLHASDYNVNLSKRRISSLINYFYEYDNGVFVPYLEGNSTKGNKLIIKKEAYGEDTAAKNISDDLSDLSSSVYSPKAAYERKIKVIAISFRKK